MSSAGRLPRTKQDTTSRAKFIFRFLDQQSSGSGPDDPEFRVHFPTAFFGGQFPFRGTAKAVADPAREDRKRQGMHKWVSRLGREQGYSSSKPQIVDKCKRIRPGSI